MIASAAFQRSIDRFLRPIANLLDDPAVSEILINGPEEIWIEKHGVLCRTGNAFPDSASLDALLVTIAQYASQTFDALHPVLEARLPDGSRLEAVMAPIAQSGTVVSIRRFSQSRLTIQQLVENRTISSSAAVFLARAIAHKANIVISGGTGSGKTSLLQALAGFFQDSERLIVLEDTHEIEIAKPHVVYLQSRSGDPHGRGRMGIRQLLHASLRLRPDRIVVGEIRGAESLDMLQAITSGHGGSMTTVHANTPRDALMRIETMALMAAEDLPHLALRGQVASAVDLIVQIGRNLEGRRRITEIAGVHKQLFEGNYRLKTFYFEDVEGVLTRRRDKSIHAKKEEAA